ncbi:hypothetical protein G9A89_022584 [Geosiphon pyriformis]|nr:hypothetical protein G9A89_022584 [Geosiphon pyriformis]
MGIIIINSLPVALQQQPLPQSQIQLSLQPPQQINMDPMTYTPIAKLEKFTEEEDNTQIWLNNIEKTIITNGWNNARALQAILYFLQDTTNSCNNNNINCLANTFTTIKQGETEAVTTYLEHFYRNLHQIQAIQANYFTVPQILNQFICGLCNFEFAKLKANHAQAVNLVMNRSSELNSKLKQFSDSIDKKLERYLANNQAVYQPPHHIYYPLPINSVSNSKISTQSRNISIKLPTSDAAANLSTTNLSVNNTCYLSTAVPTHLSATNPKAKTDTTKLKIINGSLSTDFHLLVTPEDAISNKSEANQKPLTNNIPPAIITEDKSLITIFFFEFEKPVEMLLFSGAALESKLITHIKLILNSGSASSCQVDHAHYNKHTRAKKRSKTSGNIGKIDDLPIEINSIIVLIKVLVMKATQYQALVGNDWLYKTNVTLDWTMQELQLSQNKAYQVSWVDEDHNKLPLIFSWDDKGKRKQKKKPTWNADQVWKTDNDQNKLTTTWEWKEDNNKEKKKRRKIQHQSSLIVHMLIFHYSHLTITDQNWCVLIAARNCCQWAHADNKPCLTCGKTLFNKEIWNNISGRERTCDESSVKHLNSCPHNDDKIWQMALAKIEEALPEEIRMIKNNLPELIELNWDPEPCDLIYNPPSYIIYTILKEEELISSCALEMESIFNHNLNSNNDDDKNNSSSSIQYSNENNNDSNSDTNPETYITLPDLTKEQELKWFSDNNESIIPECVHDTDAGFDLKYSEKDAIKLKPHSHTCIDLKVVLEISATTMVQLTSRSILAKKGINIREKIIDTGYVENIIAMLQNDSEKTYIIEPNEKIAQAIFLPLVKVT